MTTMEKARVHPRPPDTDTSRALLQRQVEELLAGGSPRGFSFGSTARSIMSYDHALSKVTQYYGNIGLVAALLATIQAAMVVRPPGDEQDEIAHRIHGISGFIGFRPSPQLCWLRRRFQFPCPCFEHDSVFERRSNTATEYRVPWYYNL